MNNKIFTYLVCCLGLIIPGCNNEDAVSPNVAQSEQQSILDKASKQGAGSRNGATQISGIGYFDPGDDCNDVARHLDWACHVRHRTGRGPSRLSLLFRRRVRVLTEWNLPRKRERTLCRHVQR